jgi:hypothetical protein
MNRTSLDPRARAHGLLLLCRAASHPTGRCRSSTFFAGPTPACPPGAAQVTTCDRTSRTDESNGLSAPSSTNEGAFRGLLGSTRGLRLIPNGSLSWLLQQRTRGPNVRVWQNLLAARNRSPANRGRVDVTAGETALPRPSPQVQLLHRGPDCAPRLGACRE